jgi:hypothetical protein
MLCPDYDRLHIPLLVPSLTGCACVSVLRSGGWQPEQGPPLLGSVARCPRSSSEVPGVHDDRGQSAGGGVKKGYRTVWMLN